MKQSIAVFDSGMGGVSVLNEIHKLMPAEDIIYFADSGYCPYGPRPLEIVRKRVHSITDFLLEQGAKAIVIACNAACTAALDTSRQRYPRLPIIGIEPAIKPAVEVTTNKKIGILSTELTLSGNRIANLIEKFGSGVQFFKMPAPDLVTLVERGLLSGEETDAALRKYLTPLFDAGIDTLTLSCTHFPFLIPAIEKIAFGRKITIIDNGPAVARQTRRLLTEKKLLNDKTHSGRVKFFTTGDNEAVTRVLASLWHHPVASICEVAIPIPG